MLGISDRKHKMNEYVSVNIHAVHQELLLSTVKRRKLSWFGHICHHDTLLKRPSIGFSPVNRTCNNGQSVFVVVTGSDGRTFLLFLHLTAVASGAVLPGRLMQIDGRLDERLHPCQKSYYREQ